MKKLLLFGDSNTYGYDPRGMMGMRYPSDVRWTSALRKEFAAEFEITDEGQNGRKLPRFPYDEGLVGRLVAFLEKGDVFVIMLGTNDLLLNAHPKVEDALKKMLEFLKWIKRNKDGIRTIVIGPPYISSGIDNSGELRNASEKMNEGFEIICEEYGVEYHDAGKWEIALSSDGVHFSEAGHKKFFEKISEVIKNK